MTQFGVTECGELQDPATRNLFSACGQADGPAGRYFWATATFFTLSDGWSVEEEGGHRARPHSRSQIQVSKYYLSARKCNCIQG